MLILALVGGTVVNITSWVRWKQQEVEEGFVACYSTASRESELKWLLAVGEKCETMIHVNEKSRTRRQTKGSINQLMATSTGVKSSGVWVQPWGQTGKWLRLRQM